MYAKMLPGMAGDLYCAGILRVNDNTNDKKPAIGDENYDPMLEPRFTDIAIFMRAPLAESIEGLDIALIGVPTDLGVTNRAGARHGPREIRNASSLMRTRNLAMGINPYELCRIADVGDVRFTSQFDLECQVNDIEAYFSKVRDAGVLPVTAGGVIRLPVTLPAQADR